MILWLSNLIGAVAALGLICAALVYMVSPKHGVEMLKRLALFLGGALLGVCLLRQFVACIGPLSLFILGIVIIIAAYLIREVRRSRPKRAVVARRGAERTPLLPPKEENL
jgi:Ca2+/Na+ antiporter